MNTFTVRTGAATDVGQLRKINQDAVVVDGGIYGVADGMGGHQGGEVASAIAVEVLGRGLDEPTADALDEAVQAANQAVFETGQERDDLAGMGTTLVAIAEVTVDDEPHLVIVNVGDSRGYLLRDGSLVQVTEDHSLVADLVRAGRITEEEALTHPRRNIVTRVLGLDERVRVDQFAVVPVEGDRFLLCSDGLTNEVDEDEITEVLQRIDDPSEAAEELVRLANHYGGRDNISVVLVDVVDDGGQAEKASAALAGDPSTVESDSDLEELGAVATADDAPAAGAAPLVETDETETDEAGEAGDDDDAEPDDEDAAPVGDLAGFSTALDDEQLEESTRSAEADIDEDDGDEADGDRGFSWRVAGFLFAVFLVFGIAAGALVVYARGSYYVSYDGDRVAVFQGRPDGVLLFDPTLEAHSNLLREDLLPVSADKIDGDPEFGEFDEAVRYVQNLQVRGASVTAVLDEPGSFDAGAPADTAETTSTTGTTDETTDTEEPGASTTTTAEPTTTSTGG